MSIQSNTLATLRPTLRQVFALSLLGLLLSLVLLFFLVFDGSWQTILETSGRLRDLASREVGNRVSDYLNEAPKAVSLFEKQISFAIVDPGNPDSVRTSLLSLLLANKNISEASFTYGTRTGFDSNGDPVITKSTAGQVTVFLTPEGRLQCRDTWFDGKQFVSRTSEAFLKSSPVEAPGPAMDPTLHATFLTPAGKNSEDELLSTDLHWSQLDDALPQKERRVEMSVLKSVKNNQLRFAGVIRIGLMKEQIDRAVHLDVVEKGKPNPYLIFLCDSEGRLITGFDGKDRVTVSGDDLRIAPESAPPQVRTALQLPGLQGITSDSPFFATSFHYGSITYLCTFRALQGTQHWIVGIVVPRDYYLGGLLQIRRRVLWVSVVLITAIILVGGFVLHSVGRAHSLVVKETSRMNAFEFSPSQNTSRLRDIGEVLAGLEKAKTAMRAMGKYVPVDLVRRLYHDGTEPMLGGESVDLSVLFTDIKGFTSFAEQTGPDRVAELLGRYLQVMATVMQNDKGTIDKFIGDSVMAFWNAPENVADHAILACRAALKCRDALRDLYDSQEWKDAPRFETRFGLHRCVAYVGHFGAPDRFNYTAIGDGINLASRLEGLNKHSGTTIIASENIYASAKKHFEFRLLDRVAVKGKVQGITIYELVAERTAQSRITPAMQRYEQAFEAYLRADFKAALDLLENETDDMPSRLLAERCRLLIKNPPPEPWAGIHVFDSK